MKEALLALAALLAPGKPELIAALTAAIERPSDADRAKASELEQRAGFTLKDIRHFDPDE